MLFRSNSNLFRFHNYLNFGVRYISSHAMPTVKQIVEKLNAFAPERFAEKWDNVGLLVEPRTTDSSITNILLTIDLTEDVVGEAKKVGAQMIISYHPPIFAPLKRLTQASWKERIIIDCIRNDIAVYSPHTSWDNVQEGVTDWLASALPMASARHIHENPTDPAYGGGRLCQIEGGPISERVAAQLIMKHTNVDSAMVNFAHGSDGNRPVRSYAVCAGSGASVLKGVEADLYVTGEMSHHEVLDATSNGISVVLVGHTNSERGYLERFKNILNQRLADDGSVTIHVSAVDRDPMKVMLKDTN